MALKENYKDDILDVSVNTKRKYRMTENQDGTVSFDDETVYTQEGDNFGASDMNAMAHAINNTSSDAEHTSYDNTTSGLQATNVQDAVDEINDNLAQTPITKGGVVLSTIDDKLNFIIEGLPDINLSRYDVTSFNRKHSDANPVSYTTQNKIALIAVINNNMFSLGNKASQYNSYATLTLNVIDDNNYTVAAGSYASLVYFYVFTERTSS